MFIDDFEEIEHTADWALRVRGQDLAGLFMNTARGMSRLLVQEPARSPREVEKHFELEADDAESWLVTWLNELAYGRDPRLANALTIIPLLVMR
jgi:SHS2 domain-containing protein